MVFRRHDLKDPNPPAHTIDYRPLRQCMVCLTDKAPRDGIELSNGKFKCAKCFRLQLLKRIGASASKQSK